MKRRLGQLLRDYLSNSSIVSQLWQRLPHGIYIFNYHRIGNKFECPYARDVFSCSADAFEKQVEQIKSNFQVLNSQQLSAVLDGQHLSERYAMITFDDGYKDNFDTAFPILQKHQLPALFLIPTDFIDTDAIPWWDELSFILRNNIGKTLVTPASGEALHLTQDSIEHQIRIFTRQIKQIPEEESLAFMARLRDSHAGLCEQLRERHQELFVNWHDLQVMHSAGMDIGSHTRSHKILSKLPVLQQAEELQTSKQIIEEKLGASIVAVAYPVGSKHCYTSETKLLAQKAGYRLAFNNTSSINNLLSDRHDMNRICVIDDEVNKLKATTVFHAYLRKRK